MAVFSIIIYSRLFHNCMMHAHLQSNFLCSHCASNLGARSKQIMREAAYLHGKRKVYILNNILLLFVSIVYIGRTRLHDNGIMHLTLTSRNILAPRKGILRECKLEATALSFWELSAKMIANYMSLHLSVTEVPGSRYRRRDSGHCSTCS